MSEWAKALLGLGGLILLLAVFMLGVYAAKYFCMEIWAPLCSYLVP